MNLPNFTICLAVLILPSILNLDGQAEPLLKGIHSAKQPVISFCQHKIKDQAGSGQPGRHQASDESVCPAEKVAVLPCREIPCTTLFNDESKDLEVGTEDRYLYNDNGFSGTFNLSRAL